MSAPPTAPLLVLGPAYCDLLFADLDALPALGTERFARRFLVAAGGSAITAVALRRLGRATSLVADVGDDAHGEVIRAALAREGVGTEWLRRVDAPTPVTAVLSTAVDRAFVTHLPAAAPPRDLADLLDRSGARHLHAAGFPAALAHPDLVRLCHDRGATVSFDPGWDETALTDARVRQLARDVDVLLPNRLEAARLAGLDTPDTRDGSDAPDAALDALASLRPTGVTVVKDGPAGAVGRDAQGRTRVPAPRVAVVDTTGAGDVFDAGFLDAWLAAAPLDACLRRGVACGARAVTALGGATAAPTRTELEDTP